LADSAGVGSTFGAAARLLFVRDTTFFGVCGRGEEEELAKLLVLVVGSATDLDLSLPCFWRNFGNFDAETGCGEDGDWEWRALLVDIALLFVKIT